MRRREIAWCNYKRQWTARRRDRRITAIKIRCLTTEIALRIIKGDNPEFQQLQARIAL